MTEQEIQLVKLAKNGDRRAFENLAALCAKEIYNFAYRLSGSRDKAQDIAQEAFVNAYKSIGSFRSDCSFASWIRRITVNVWKNTVRYEVRRQFSKHDSIDEQTQDEDGAEMEKQVASNDAGAEEVLDSGVKSDKVQAVLNNMDPGQRAIMILRDIDEKSYGEICIMTGHNLGTVKSRLARARQAFKEIYTEMYGDQNDG